MRIENKAISQIHTFTHPSVLGQHQCSSRIGSIHMQPDFLALQRAAYFFQGIHGQSTGGSSCGHHRTGLETLFQVSFIWLFPGAQDPLQLLICSHLDQVSLSNSTYTHRFFDGRMGFGGAIYSEIPLGTPFFVGTESGSHFPGSDQCHQRMQRMHCPE